MRIAKIAAFVVAVGVLAAVAVWPGPSGTVQAGPLTMSECEYRTEAGTVAAECGTLVVPENRRDPSSDLIGLPVVRIPAASGAASREPIFRLGGGPGNTNLKFPQASRFTDTHDVVLVGYRGIDGSRRLDCPEVTGYLQTSDDLSAEVSLPFKACADRLTKDAST